MRQKGAIVVAILSTLSFALGSPGLTDSLSKTNFQAKEKADKLILMGQQIRRIDRILVRVEASTGTLRNSPNAFPFDESDCGSSNRTVPTEDELSEKLSQVFERLIKIEDQNLRYLQKIGRIPGRGGISAPIPDQK